MSDAEAEPDLLRQGLPGARRLGAAVEQPQAAHARPAQDLARLRRAPQRRSRDFLGARGFLKDVVPHVAERDRDA